MSWRFFFKENVIAGAQSYLDSGALCNYKHEGDTVTADVKGMETYHVQIRFHSMTGYEMKCTCPLAQTGGRCKHMAAVMLKWEALYSEKVRKEQEERRQEYEREKKERGRRDIITGELIEGNPVVYRLEHVGRILSCDHDKKEIYDSTTDGYGYLKEETLQKIVEITADRRDYVWHGMQSSDLFFRIYARVFTEDKSLIVNLANRLYASILSIKGSEVCIQSSYLSTKHVVGRFFKDWERTGIEFAN